MQMNKMLDEGGGRVVDGSRPADCAYHKSVCEPTGFRDPPTQSTGRDPSIPYPNPHPVRVPSQLETFSYTLGIYGETFPAHPVHSSRRRDARTLPIPATAILVSLYEAFELRGSAKCSLSELWECRPVLAHGSD